LQIFLSDNLLVWTNAPFVASKHDVTIFCEDEGLKEKTPKGKKGIADQGYRGEKAIICTPNSHDTPALREYKVRASVHFACKTSVDCQQVEFAHDT
jgi:hypothetical protein